MNNNDKLNVSGEEIIENKQSKVTNKKSLKVAIFIIAAIVVFYLGANFLKGIDTFGKKIIYYAVFENISGVVVGSSVLINGYPIGKIKSLQFVDDKKGAICAEMLIKEYFPIPTDSKINLESALLGGTTLNVQLGNATTYIKNRDTIQVEKIPGLMDVAEQLVTKLNSTLVSIDSIAFSLKEAVVTNHGADNLAKSLDNIEKISADIKNVTPNLNRLVADLTHFSAMLKDNSTQLNQIIANMNNIADSIAKANVASVIKKLDHTMTELNGIVAKINKGDGNVGKLVNDEALYKDIETAIKDVDILIKDIKENPKRYINITVFGKKEKK
ncbi:MAG: MlaD family protein [Bacteroidales bacterium]|jgi:phospholipid/cholesterol/gamma-HCH transport system substrate-binding protein|nr:MlaD family protein [Bacteroidales bacterium]